MNAPAVSVIIINYNTFELTIKCIETVLRETKGVEIEIIVVDNGSTETDPERFKEHFPGILLVKSKENIGFAKGNNLGILHSSGEHLLLLNSDIEFRNDVCTILTSYLKKNKEVGVVTGKLLYPNGRIQNNCQRFPNWKVSLFELLRLQKILKKKGGDYLLGPFFLYDKRKEVDWVWGTCMMFRKKDLSLFPAKVLNEDFFMYGEDMQWCLEFKRIGKKVVFLPEAEVIHYLGGSNMVKRNLMQEQNLDQILTSYYSPFHKKLIKVLNKLLIL
jgi:GT2 family glycosyltransferase